MRAGRFAVVVVAASAFMFAGCGGSSGGQAAKSTSPATSAGVSTTTAGATTSSGASQTGGSLLGPADLCVLITKAQAEAIVGPNPQKQDSGATECVWGSSDASKRVYVQRMRPDSPGVGCGTGATPVSGLGNSAERRPGCFSVKVIQTVFVFGSSDTSVDLEALARTAVGRL